MVIVSKEILIDRARDVFFCLFVFLFKQQQKKLQWPNSFSGHFFFVVVVFVCFCLICLLVCFVLFFLSCFFLCVCVIGARGVPSAFCRKHCCRRLQWLVRIIIINR